MPYLLRTGKLQPVVQLIVISDGQEIAQQWKCDAAIIHLNRGCEGTATHQMELKIALAETGLPSLTYEGNMADEREFDEARDLRLIDLFLTETMGLKKLKD